MRHLALVGATASGKSELALSLARTLGDVEVVSVDSMQVYRGMDIGTSKPSRQERAEIPHHLLDLANPNGDWTVVEWLGAATCVLAEIESRGRRALLVGGTGLYFHTLVDGFEVPGRYPEVAAELDADPDTASLYRRLCD
ncbi:MAG: tRNA (adenosine(37)-N6)-dimethylallyltransferase, partial [Acidimicrobiales bacterium]